MKRTLKITLLTTIATFIMSGCGSSAGNTCCDTSLHVEKSVIQKTGKTATPIIGIKSKERKEVEPKKPIAIAHANGQRDMILVSTCQSIEFDANSSYDPDATGNKELNFKWTNINDEEIANTTSFVKKYNKRGVEELTLTVTDEQNLTATDRVCVLVGINESCIPLLPKIDGNLNINENEATNLTARSACRDNSDLRFEWREGNQTLSDSTKLNQKFSKGKHLITLIIEDLSTGKKSYKQIILTVK